MTTENQEGRHTDQVGGASETLSLRDGVDKPEDNKSTSVPQHVSGPLTRRNAVDTSRSAATVARKTHGRRCRRAYLFIKSAGDATCEELQQALAEDGESWLLTTVRARVCDLHREALITPSGRRGIGESGTAKVAAWRCTTEEERLRILAERAAKTATDTPAEIVSEACRRARAILATSENVFQALVAAYTAQLVAEGGVA